MLTLNEMIWSLEIDVIAAYYNTTTFSLSWLSTFLMLAKLDVCGV